MRLLALTALLATVSPLAAQTVYVSSPYGPGTVYQPVQQVPHYAVQQPVWTAPVVCPPAQVVVQPRSRWPGRHHTPVVQPTYVPPAPVTNTVNQTVVVNNPVNSTVIVNQNNTVVQQQPVVQHPQPQIPVVYRQSNIRYANPVVCPPAPVGGAVTWTQKHGNGTVSLTLGW